MGDQNKSTGKHISFDFSEIDFCVKHRLLTKHSGLLIFRFQVGQMYVWLYGIWIDTDISLKMSRTEA